MPQLTWRSLSFWKTPSHGPHIVAAAVTSTSGAPASSCDRAVSTDVRVQPGTAQGTGLSSRAASFCSQSPHRPWGAGRLFAKAAIWAATGQVHVPAQPGRSQARSWSRVFASLSRHGSHIDDAGSSGEAAPRPPSLRLARPLPFLLPPAAAIEIHVRAHPGTEQVRDLAPRRSASVNPREPMGTTEGPYADRNPPGSASANV